MMLMLVLVLLTQVSDADAVLKTGLSAGVNLRKVDAKHVGISLDETTSIADVDTLLKVCMKENEEGRRRGLC